MSVCLSVGFCFCHWKWYRATHLNISDKWSRIFTNSSGYIISLPSWLKYFFRISTSMVTLSQTLGWPHCWWPPWGGPYGVTPLGVTHLVITHFELSHLGHWNNPLGRTWGIPLLKHPSWFGRTEKLSSIPI